MLNVTFAEINAELHSIEPQLDAAEAHGCLCGVLCTVKNLSLQHWLQEILAIESDDEVAEAIDIQSLADSSALEQLFSESQQSLQGDSMEFALLLPDDDQPLPSRVAAMAQWVAGFLYGFGIGALNSNEFPESVSEALQDFTQIARANPDEVAETEEDENAYAELTEYLRAAVQVVYDELESWRVAQVSTQSQSGLLN
jgi:uncharacterized protein YgfB (UPF0149 family)